jgi:outer membrane biogenesis lipoprotein LolB
LINARHWAFGIAHCALLGVLLSACAKPHLNLPADAGAPLPDFQQVHASVSTACKGVRTMTAELGLSGRAGDQRLRGRVVAGFERPAAMRLEGVAPFGAPAFILAARGGTAVLWLPRDGRVVRGAAAEEILGALTGVTLAAVDLQAILTGCVVAEPMATAGRLHANGWASVDLEGGATVYLQRSGGGWAVRAARRAGWQIEYPAWQGSFPASTRLQSLAPGPQVDLTATVSQLEVNVAVDAAAFTLTVPADARAMTIDDLRAAGPLRGP